MSAEDKIAGLPLVHWLQFGATILMVGIAWGTLSAQLSHERERREALERRIEAVRVEQMRTARDEIAELKAELRRLSDRIDRVLGASPPSYGGAR